MGKAIQGTDGRVMFQCPACKNLHGKMDDRWTFDGNYEEPTFSPSFLVHSGKGMKDVCHSFVRNGMIQFLDDCTHELKGQTVPLPEWKEIN